MDIKNIVDKLGYVDAELDTKLNLVAEIARLKEQKKAVILAHYYQPADVQAVADFVGDSLALSQRAADLDRPLILFAGVRFMAETAKILAPQSKVILPDLNAGCSLADSCSYDAFREFVEQHPDHKVVTYVNTTAEIKSLSYICCTSSNAVQVVNSIPAHEPVIFAPDRNLGGYIKRLTGRQNMVVWEGACHVHDQFSVQRILELKQQHPQAKIIAHPECKQPVLLLADFVGSTAQLLGYTQQQSVTDFIVATEAGILTEMMRANPTKNYIPAPPDDSSCACNECSYMKLTTLKKLYLSLLYELPEIEVDAELARLARVPIERMLRVV